MAITRRCFGSGLVGSMIVAASPGRLAARPGAASLEQDIAAIERRADGRLGVAILDTADGSVRGYRLDERFPMCSTFKALAAAAVLTRVDRGQDRLDRLVRYPAGVLVPYSPVTKPHVGTGMTLGAICEAAVTLSDNTAGNLMLEALGGPQGLTHILRDGGDPVTRLDRTEPTLNEARPGDPRDTTSPRAMAETLRRFVLGDMLKPASRALFTQWLVGCKTGDKRLRAGAPKAWTVGDKTGTGRLGTTNDVAVMWPADRAPLVVTAYLTQSSGPLTVSEACLVDIGRLAAL